MKFVKYFSYFVGICAVLYAIYQFAFIPSPFCLIGFIYLIIAALNFIHGHNL